MVFKKGDFECETYTKYLLFVKYLVYINDMLFLAYECSGNRVAAAALTVFFMAFLGLGRG